MAASRVSLAACVRTRRPVVFDGVVAVALRRAAGLRCGAALAAAGLLAAGLLAAGLLAAGLVAVVVVVVVLVFSAMWLFPPALRFGFLNLCSPRRYRRTYVRKPKSWTGYSGLLSL